jgi:hypothetical protein
MTVAGGIQQTLRVRHLTARAGAAARRGDPASLSAVLAHAPPTFTLYQRLEHALRRGYVNEAGREQEFRKGTSSKVGQGGAGGRDVGFDLGQAEIAQCKTHTRNARPRGIMHHASTMALRIEPTPSDFRHLTALNLGEGPNLERRAV